MLAELDVRRLAAEALGEHSRLFLELLQVVHLAHRRAGDPSVFGECLEDRLADPPDGVGDELEPARLVEPLDRLEQADVSLGDQLEQGKPVILVLPGYADDEPEIGRDDLFPRLLVSLLDAGEQVELVPPAQRLGIPDIPPVDLGEVLDLVPLLGSRHRHSPEFRQGGSSPHLTAPRDTWFPGCRF